MAPLRPLAEGDANIQKTPYRPGRKPLIMDDIIQQSTPISKTPIRKSIAFRKRRKNIEVLRWLIYSGLWYKGWSRSFAGWRFMLFVQHRNGGGIFDRQGADPADDVFLKKTIRALEKSPTLITI